jgi:thiol-disulfide isomerase/thioredoxin
MHKLFFLLALLVATPALAEPVDFTLPDLDGKPVSLSDYRGKWVIVNYWATWCPPCLEEIPELVSLHEDNSDTLVVLGVDYEEVNTGYLKEFVESHMMSYPVVRTDPVPVTALGPVMGLPTTYIISPTGERLARQEGPVTQADIEKYIARKQKQAAGTTPVAEKP